MWSDEQEIYPSSSRDENCIEFEFQTYRNRCVDLRQTYLVLKPDFVKGPNYKTYETEKKVEHKHQAKTDEKPAEKEEEAPVPLVTHA